MQKLGFGGGRLGEVVARVFTYADVKVGTEAQTEALRWFKYKP